MNTRRLLLTLAFGLTIASATAVHAQVPVPQVPRYQPYSPTVSPYLNLLRSEGAIPNYFTLVRPFQRQAQFNRQVQQFARQQLLENQRVEQRFSQPITPSTGTAAGFMTIGSRSGYQEFSHYYQQPTVQNRRRR